MVLKPLLQTRAVLDLCGGELILPIAVTKGTRAPGQFSEQTALSPTHLQEQLSEQEQQQLQNFLLTSSYEHINHKREGGKSGMGARWKYPLHTAVSHKNVDMVRLLLVAGAQADCRDSENRTPLELAQSKNLNNSDGLLNEIADLLTVAQSPNFSGVEPDTCENCDQTHEIQAEIATVNALLQHPQRAVAELAGVAMTPGSIGGDEQFDFVQDVSMAELGNSATLANLTKTLSIGVSLLNLWAAEAQDPQVTQVARAFSKCLELVKVLPRPLLTQEMDVSRRLTALQEDFAKFLSSVVECVRSIKPGCVGVVPLGWLRNNMSRAEGEASEDGGHCVLLVIARPPASKEGYGLPSLSGVMETLGMGATQAAKDAEAPIGSAEKQEDASDEKFVVGIVNTGEGLEYHPVSAAGTAPHPGQAVRQSPLILTDIASRRLTNSSFWYLVYRQILYPSESNGPEMLYGTLLPALNQKPLSANFGTEPDGWVNHLPSPVSGDTAYACCFERAVRFAFVASGSPAAYAAWSGVAMRCKLITSMKDALQKALELKIPLSAGERAFLRIAMRSVARSASLCASQYPDQEREEDLQQVKVCIEEADQCLKETEAAEESPWSLLPPPLSIADANPSTEFANFDKLLRQEVDQFKGAEDPPRILVPALTAMMPRSVKDPAHAAATVRLAAHLLTLLVNQQDQIAHSVPVRFALVVHLMTRLLPMPLPLDHPEKRTRCFWMQKMSYETKTDLMKHIHLVSRHFAAVAFTVRAKRESDGARVCVAAGLAALMDALLRQPVEYAAHADGIDQREQLISSVISLHYSGKARGPCSPFGLDRGDFERQSESLLLFSPEYASLRALLLDYFRSTSATLDDKHVIFKFDRSMQCSEGDRLFVEQLGLSLGIGDAKREAHLLLTGDRPDLLELYPELGFFRDVVFLWKMLLLPVGEGPPQKNWRANDSVLFWYYEEEQFKVNGFEMNLCAKMEFDEDIEEETNTWWLTSLFSGGGYNSAKKALSGASPSVLTNSKVETEDDVLHLENLPTFNDTLGPADSELLLTYLTAPYLRVPLILGFFTEKEHLSLLREPALQNVLDSALFEPGPWCSQSESVSTIPQTIPASDRKHLHTPVGLLFNELLKSPHVVLNAVLSMLRSAYDKDNGSPDSANAALILYLIRMAVRVESYLLFIIEHIRQDAYLRLSGANWYAKVPGLLDKDSGAYKIKDFEQSHKDLRQGLMDEIDGLLQNWIKVAMQDRLKENMISHACRAQAHLALLYKNITVEQFGVREVAILLSAQLYLNMHHRFANIYTDEELEAHYSLGASEFEVFDMFESKRTDMASWLRAYPDKANEVFEKVEQVVTSKGTVDELFPGQTAYKVRDWVQLFDQPGNFVPMGDYPKQEELDPKASETFEDWLQRTTRRYSSSTSLISVNLGMFKTQREKNQLIPDWATQSQDYQEAFGRKDVVASDKEVSSDRVCKILEGHRHEIQRWTENAPIPELKVNSMRKYQPEGLGVREKWLRDIFEPVRAAVPGLDALELYLKSGISNEEHAEVWMSGLMETRAVSAKDGRDVIRMQLKEVMVQRSPPLVEVYNVIEYGRQFYNTLIFSSDALWTFGIPFDGESRLLHHPSTTTADWTLASGNVDEFSSPTPSVVTYRNLNHRLGRQMYVPPRLLHGLLPEILIERYKFWRSEEHEGLLIGNEKQACDTPTRIQVHIRKVRNSHVGGEETHAKVERWILKQQNGNTYEECEVDQAKGSEVLVNMRKSFTKLATVLARVENFSHILVWTKPDKKSDGSLNFLHKVELPRLDLSFSGEACHLRCDQHKGFWVMERKLSGPVVELLKHWGGGTLLLENEAGELMVLTSAVAEPIIPAACGAELDYAEKFLPGQLMFRRGQKSWLSQVNSESRHHYYPMHLTGTFIFTPTFAAKLYLMLCRFATWHFEEVATTSSAFSEVLSTEEKQLWDHLSHFENGCHADAIACRLHLTIAAEPYGAKAAPAWDLKTELIAYVQKRHLVSVNCALAPSAEIHLLRSLDAAVMSQNLDLKVRLNTLEQLEGSAAEPKDVAASLGVQVDDLGYERIADSSFTAIPSDIAGAFNALGSGLGYDRPSFNQKGMAGVKFLDTLFPNSKGGLASLSVSWWLLYELFTGSFDVILLNSDESSFLASFLLRLYGKDGARNLEMSVLRALDINPHVRSAMPKCGEGGGRKRACVRLSEDLQKGSIKLTTGDFHPVDLTTKSKSFRFVPAEVQKSMRSWTGPITSDMLADERTFQNVGQNFDGRPLQEIAANYVEEAEHRGDIASTKHVQQQLMQIDLHTFSAKRTLERLNKDLNLTIQKTVQQIGLKPRADLRVLKYDLAKQKEKDIRDMNEALGKIDFLANKGSVADWLCRRAGDLANIRLSMVVRALCAQSPACNVELRKANPMLADEDISSMFDETAQLLCRTVRIGQISRVQAAIDRLEAAAKGGPLQVQLKQQAVARELAAARSFTEMAHHSSDIKYDPRLLVFEYLFNMILRSSQVKLMATFCECIQKRQSICHQMIMGAGKTTVIAPLLAMILADGDRLCVACMPQELLALSRSVLMEKFSAAVLPKPVLTLQFERFSSANDALLTKLEAARRRRAILVAAPNALKSLLLKQVEMLNQLDMARRYSSAAGGVFEPPPRRGFLNLFARTAPSSQKTSLRPEEIDTKTSEVITCNKILQMFHNGSMLMDEVDLLLDPRKSELNWPLGAKVPLDLTDSSYMTKRQEGLRYKLPFHLLDAIFVASQGKAMTMPYADRREAETTLTDLRKVIDDGENTRRLQKMPHLIILSVEFYMKAMMPLMARWAGFFLEPLVRGAVRSDELQKLLQEAEMPKEVTERLRAADDVVIKMLNLTRDWLHTLLPHVLSKVHRVSYGLLVGEDYIKAPPGTPQSRKFLAIPFVGKDRPSSMSEFQHPDITIGFTILSYRYNGMRQDDMTMLWRIMIHEMKIQNAIEYHRRDACRDYVKMVTQAGGFVRGFTADGKWVRDLETENRDRRRRASTVMSKTMQKLWPLEAIDITDPEHMKALFDLLHDSPHCICYFLEQFVFPSDSGILDSNSNQLSASGQELAGSQLFGLCLGFSGTPNDLLPRSMGKCAYAEGDDGDILAVLGSPDVVSVLQHESWNPEMLLNIIANSRADHGPKYHALIDTGALITGMTNYEVAEYLLKEGLAGIQGVIFLDSNDERMVLVRNGMRVMHLAQCGLSPDERFTFYDHVHTTGMDIPQPLTCTACLTVSKDMTFRDYSQGAYRMRGIGKGQCIEVFLIPEVSSLMNNVLGRLEGGSEEARTRELEKLHRRGDSSWTQKIILDLTKWLIVNGIQGEDKRHMLLCQQSVENIWRRAAACYLEKAPTTIWPDWINDETTTVALNVLRNRIDTQISNKLDSAGEQKDSIKDKLTKDFCSHLKEDALLWQADQKSRDRDEGFSILEELQGDERTFHLDLETSKVKEKEIEQETEQEQEREQMQQQELQLESERQKEAPVNLKYARDDERLNQWPLKCLAPSTNSWFSSLSSAPSSLPFYKISELQINMSLLQRAFSPLGRLPGYVMVSDNYYRSSWRKRILYTRRLKNIICFLEWVPNVSKLQRLDVKTPLNEEQKAHIADAFKFYDTDKSGELLNQELRLLLKDMGLHKECESILSKYHGRSLNLRQLEEEIALQRFHMMQDGRFFVVLTLEEAEHLRASMHLLNPDVWSDDCGLALRCIGNLESALRDSLIDEYGPVLSTAEQKCQLEAAEQLLRFTNSSLSYQADEISILLRLLQMTPLEARQNWWLSLRACRRRSQQSWQQLEIASLFAKADEFEDMPTKALLSNMRWAFCVLEMSPADAFSKLDTDHSDELSRQEIQKGLQWIQDLVADPDIWSRHIDALFEFMDKGGNGAIDKEEFNLVMQVEERDRTELLTEFRKSNRRVDVRALKLASPEAVNHDAIPELPPDLLSKMSRGRFEIKWQRWATKKGWKCVWNTQGTGAEEPLAIWEPIAIGDVSWFDVTEAVCLGHFICVDQSFEIPEEGGAPMVLTIKDTKSSGIFNKRNRSSLNHFLERIMPNPVKFSLEWQLRPPKGDKYLYIWQPVPPSDAYVALGCVSTTTDQAPPLDSMRCVPKLWTEQRDRRALRKQWTDKGMGGIAAAFWRVEDKDPLSFFNISAGQDSYSKAPDMWGMKVVEEKAFYAEMPPW